MDRQYRAMGERIRQARRSKNLTQQDVADALNVSVQSVSQWETGRTRAEPDRLLTLAKLIDSDWEFLADGKPSLVSSSGLMAASELNVLNGYAERLARLVTFQDLGELDLLPVQHPYPNAVDDNTIVVRYAGSGRLFAFEVTEDDNEPLFKIGDLVVIDTGISIRVGDYVVALEMEEYLKNRNTGVFLRQVRGIKLDLEDKTLIELHAVDDFNHKPKLMKLDADYDRIIGTVVEHRKLRRR
ncbi:LexA family transcriptional regulator [Bosea sp. PAMC 26642]|uniref:LexA family transcriptional regulator n=1 Tax=Bosea sp. (strain PAMC 26642) TaxID=1792307 RepID=UPI0007703C52|nr:LexA family transcriptional regulator [Bosea sp. PAMC 26642]AMJ60931.1 hypothetical protein AXW83_12070 [Bosea sp. PAMC 26642]